MYIYTMSNAPANSHHLHVMYAKRSSSRTKYMVTINQ